MTRPGPRHLLLILAAALLVGALSPSMVPLASAQSPAAVKIQNFAFSPATITLVIGVNNTVTWTNMDSVIHTVTADGGTFGSNDLSNGQTFTFTFTTPGSYGYHCSIHTYMKGTVIVKGSGSTTTSSATTTSTTTATSSATSTAATSLTTTSSSQATVSPTTTSSPGGVPEFPFQGALLTLLTLALVASYFVIRRNVGGRTHTRPTSA